MASVTSVELQILYCALALGIVQLVLSATLNLFSRGLPWGVGPRDETPKPLSKLAGRTDRAFKNFLETFVFFGAAVLLDNALGKHTANSALGAQLYIWGRLAFLPLYMIGIPWLRTVAWFVALAGILLVMSPIWPG